MDYYGLSSCTLLLSVPRKNLVLNFSRQYARGNLVLILLNPLIANPTKWSNTLKKFLGQEQCFSNARIVTSAIFCR